MDNKKNTENFLELIKKYDNSLKFEIFEIGGHPYDKKNDEPFYKLLDFFPNSRINSFDVDEEECLKLNLNSKDGVEFFPYAVGKTNEVRKFYETNHPMCSSLYKPNKKLLELYNNLEVAQLKKTSEIKTITLDEFIKKKKIEFVDFIKIDIQGAELDVFEGAHKCLESTLSVVSEVEFLRIYENQPLFGDICSFLDKKNIMFHKFFRLSGRSLKPIKIDNDVNHAIQHLWSDAMFIKNILVISKLNNSQLLKLSILSYIYGSPDLTVFCLLKFDEKNKTNVADLFREINLK